MRLKFIVLLFLVSLVFSGLFCESLDKKLKSLTEENAKGFTQPLVTALGCNFNSGLYSTAKVLKPLTFSVYINSSLAFIPDSDKEFNAKHFDGTEFESATIYGGNGSTIPGAETHNLPKGANISVQPLFIPQVSVGMFGGNEIMLRYLPSTELDKEIGEISFWGLGLKHSIDQYFPGIIPIDLATQIVYQNLKVGDSVDLSNIALNAHISKKLLMWTIYGGLGFENTTMNVNYTPEIDYISDYTNTKIDFDLDGDNGFRATAGVRYSILLLKLYADYTLCKDPVINMGFGVSF